MYLYIIISSLLKGVAIIFNKLTKTTTEENIKKDFKKLSNYTIHAKGYRTINGFAADCNTNADYLADIINNRINSYPTITFLKLLADNSEGRVTLKEFALCCGYSNYTNNDMNQVKDIYVRRGWFCYADFGDNSMDSEVGGHRLILILQNDIGNSHSSNTIVYPVTSRKKRNYPTHVNAGSDCGLPDDSTIMCESPMTISKRRLIQNGTIMKVSECPIFILKKVEVALLKAQGVIDIRVNEKDAIESLKNINSIKTYQYEKSQHIGGKLLFSYLKEV